MLRILLLLSQARLIPLLGPYHFNIYIHIDAECQNILLHNSADSTLQCIFVARISSFKAVEKLKKSPFKAVVKS